MSHFLCLASTIDSNVDVSSPSAGMAWLGRKFTNEKSPECHWHVRGVCRIVGENCHSSLAHYHYRRCHHHPSYDDITVANFILQFISSYCACMCVCSLVWVCDGEKQARPRCNSVCEGTNTHLYDNFLFTMSKDSNTDTIHFPFINWCGNVGPGRSDFWSLSGLRGGTVCFTGGRRKLLAHGRWFREACIHNNVFARDKRPSLYERLAATGSKLFQWYTRRL